MKIPLKRRYENCFFLSIIRLIIEKLKSVKMHGGQRQCKKSRSKRAGLQLPVGRINRYLREGRYSKRIGDDAPVFLAAVMEYLTAEVLDLAITVAWQDGKIRVKPRHLKLAYSTDSELDTFLSGVIFAQGGVLPRIQPELIKRR